MLNIDPIRMYDAAFEGLCKASHRPEFQKYMTDAYRNSNRYHVGCAFCVEASLSLGEDDVRFVFHVMYLNPHYVFVGEYNPKNSGLVRDIARIPGDRFENTSNHESCWRDSANQYINKRVQSEMDRLRSLYPKAKQEPRLFVSMPGLFVPYIKLIKARLSNTEDGYHYRVEEVIPLEYEITLKGL